MSNPTTPFSWQMPTATDLVTDLPADFAVFGQAVATSMADLLGGTTGQVLAKTTSADMDFTWTTPQVGDITGVTAGVGISGGGTSGTVTVTNDMATTITTNGDLLYGTGSGTYTRRAIGSTGNVLTVAGGIPTWAAPAAGGMTLLSTTTLSGASTAITGIDQTYVNLQIVISGTTNASANYYPRALPNGTANIATYYAAINSNATAVNQAQSATDFAMNYGLRKQTDTSNVFVITINNYATTTMKKAFISTGTQVNSSSQVEAIMFGGFFDISGAISSLTITASAGTYNAGTVLIYGVK